MMRGLALLLAMLAAGAACAAEEGPAEQARQAAAQLEEASLALERAGSARNRVRALTTTVRGYEAGLAAMRAGLRAAALREARLSRDLKAREGEVAQLLGVLLSMGRRPAPTLLLHPGGPTGTARSGMLLAEVTPALQARADALRDELREVTALRELQQDAADRLARGLLGVQKARTRLSQAIADRRDLPRRFAADPARTRELITATETLAGFASGLTGIARGEPDGSLPSIAERKGTLALPVRGRILRRAGEADAAGVRRPGLVLATRPGALVTTPAAATIRYRGPLLDYGLVTILEPQADTLFVLAGLGTVFGEPGQVLPAGSPVGLMGGGEGEALSSRNGEAGASDSTETLYVEVREGDDPVDPETWFQTSEE